MNGSNIDGAMVEDPTSNETDVGYIIIMLPVCHIKYIPVATDPVVDKLFFRHF